MYYEIKTIKNYNESFLVEYSHVIEKYQNYYSPSGDSSRQISKIWVMWWQGEEEMPEVVKICYKSIIENAGNFEVTLITRVNYMNYIDLPDYILQKVDSGLISITHLSDLIRSILLSEIGGLWLDATILLTTKLEGFKGMAYWSPKWKLNYSQRNKYPLWRGLWEISNLQSFTIAQCMGVWYSDKNNIIFKCLTEFWLTYWSRENNKPYYWSTEIFLIGCLYNKIDSVRRQIDSVPFNNPKIFDLADIVNCEYDKIRLENIMSDTSFFYLSWKETYFEEIKSNGNVTNYKFLKSKYL